MMVKVIGKYVIPLMTDDNQSHSEQMRRALAQAEYSIHRMGTEHIKAEVLNNLQVEIIDN